MPEVWAPRIGGLVLGWVSLWCCAQAQAQVTVTPQGDLGLRYRGVFVQEGSPSERLANRMESLAHLRLHVADASETLEAQVQLSTGSPTALSSQWTEFGVFAQGQSLQLDQAWVGWSLDHVSLTVTLGKWQVPWSHEGLMWSPEVDLPGVKVDFDWTSSQGALRRVRVNPALVLLSDEGSQTQDEIWLYGGELSTQWELDQQKLTLAVGLFGLSHPRRLGRAIARGDLRAGLRPAGFTANTTDTDDTLGAEQELTQRLVIKGLASEFTQLTLWGAWQIPWGEALPMRAHVHAVYNLGAAGPGADAGLGADVGLRLGEATSPGEGQFMLRGLWVGADAVLDVFNHEMIGANLRGFGLDGSLMALRGFTVGFQSLVSARVDEDLRGLGSGRGEPGGADGIAAQVHVVTRYVF